MATTWTTVDNSFARTWTTVTNSYARTWRTLEPPGWGRGLFGHPTSGKTFDTGEDKKIFSIHDRGFGNPTTKWTQYDETP